MVKERIPLSRAAIITRLLELNAALWPAPPVRPWQIWMDLDLTMSQLKLVLLIAANGGSRVGDLAHRLGVTPPTVTTSLDRLVNHGLVRRVDDPVDRRLVIARLTTQGTELLQRLHLHSGADMHECIAALDEDSLRCLLIGMEALHSAYQSRCGRVPGGADDAIGFEPGG